MIIRNLFIAAAGGLVLSAACIGGAAALVSHDIGKNGWTMTMVKDGDHVHFVKGAPAQPDTTTTKTLAWAGGDTLSLNVPSDVTYVQGDTPGITLSGPASLLDRIKLDGHTLSYTDGPDHPKTVTFKLGPDGFDAHGSDDDKVRITVTAPAVTHFDLSGDGDLTLQNYDQKTLELDLSGDGSVNGTGHADALKLAVSGDGDADLGDLETTSADVNVSGDGGATLSTVDKATVDISGSGDVDFKTKPTITSHISGTGSVNQD